MANWSGLDGSPQQCDGLAADVFGVSEPIFFSLNTEHEILQDMRVYVKR